MNKQIVWTFEQLMEADLETAVVWCTPSVRTIVENKLSYPFVDALEVPEFETRSLIVIGGGTMLDQAKSFRADTMPWITLVAIPSIWGSGAEASPVVVLNRQDKKEIRVGPAFLPDIRVIWPDLAATVPLWRARAACGDVWSHALEAFLSPLAEEELRARIAEMIRSILDLPLGYDPRWLERSAQACEAQAQSSVGLVHGIAHTLENVLRQERPDLAIGHARLCQTFLWPVMELNRRGSDKWSQLSAAHGIDQKAVFRVIHMLFDNDLYESVLPMLETNWKNVLRDPCTRTNSTLVRPAHLSHFLEKTFR